MLTTVSIAANITLLISFSFFRFSLPYGRHFLSLVAVHNTVEIPGSTANQELLAATHNRLPAGCDHAYLDCRPAGDDGLDLRQRHQAEGGRKRIRFPTSSRAHKHHFTGGWSLRHLF
jgi:hypothetical protein